MMNVLTDLRGVWDEKDVRWGINWEAHEKIVFEIEVYLGYTKILLYKFFFLFFFWKK